MRQARVGRFRVASEAPDLVLTAGSRVTVERMRRATLLLVVALPAALATIEPFAGTMTMVFVGVILVTLTLIQTSRQVAPDLIVDPVSRLEVRAASEEVDYRSAAAPWHLIVNGRRFERSDVKRMTIKEVCDAQGNPIFVLYLVLERALIRLDEAADRRRLNPLIKLLRARLGSGEAIQSEREQPCWSAGFRVVGFVLLEAAAVVMAAMAPVTFLSDTHFPAAVFLICSTGILLVDLMVVLLGTRVMREPVKRYLATNFDLRF